MALWQIGNRPAGTVPNGKGSYVPASSVSTDLDAAPIKIVYPDSNGVTGGNNYNYTNSSSGNSSDKYGGSPISINTGNSASGLDSVAGVLGNGFSGLFDLIQQNTSQRVQNLHLCQCHL